MSSKYRKNTVHLVGFLTAAAFILFAGVPFAAGEEIVIRETAGKVEIRRPGGGWARAAGGEEIPLGTVVSTGFNSTAVLDLGQSSIDVRPLTRMSVAELVRRDETVTTDLFLDVGRVRAEVRSAEGLRHDFSIRSTVSTASVRGTILEGDGEEWESEEGTFVVSGRGGQTVTVTGGEKTTVKGSAPPSTPQSEFGNDTGVDNTANPAGFDVPPAPRPPSTASVTITWE